MKKNLILIIEVLFIIFFSGVSDCTIQEKKQFNDVEFKHPPTKLHIWWHWLDGNITKDGITKDLEAMKKQGIVQATILNVGLGPSKLVNTAILNIDSSYGNRDLGIKKIVFNTPEWFEMFQWALKEASRLGISIGVHDCDGWSTSGGPWITSEMSMKQYVWIKTIVSASQPGIIKLKQPLAKLNFYKDVAVVALKSACPQNSFQQATPDALLNENEKLEYLFDGCPSSASTISKGDKITFQFKEAFIAEKIAVMPRKIFMWGDPSAFSSTYSISSSEDGKNYKKIKEFTIQGLNKLITVPFEKTSAKFFRLSFLETNNMEDYIPLTISECELLPQNENPLYSSGTDYLMEKVSNVKAVNETNFYSLSNTSDQNGIKEVIDITSKMGSDGTLNWKPREGNWTIIRFGYTATGMTNAPATPAGIGLECDKMDTAALNLHFKSFPAKLIEKAGSYIGNTFKFMLIDSWEAGYQNWTTNMMKEFLQRRGYSLISYIPVLCGESSGNSEIDEGILFDFRKTIAELIEDNYYKHFGELLHKYKLEYHAEVMYGGTGYPPLDILKSTRYVDLPMFEFWARTDNEYNVTYSPSASTGLNMPSCAAIGYEKPVMGSEAYTGWVHYSETPAGLKPFGDRAFCAGINLMILHTYVHQPFDSKPGFALGDFGSYFTRNNSYWPYISGWLNYQSRIQYLLQQGVVSHDVLYYLGDQLPQNLSYNVSNELPFGYLFNACNFDILKNRIKVEGRKLVLNGKTSYSVLSLSPFEGLNFETLKRIEELVKEGIILYAPKPLHMLSLKDIKNNKEAFNLLVTTLWGKIDGNSVTSNNYGKGKIYWGIPLSEVLRNEKILPDFSTHQKDASNLMFIHKKIDSSDVYFVMNQQNHEIRREMSFRITGKTPEIWNPEYGSIIKPAIYSMNEKYTTLPVLLKPYQSLLFVFKDENPENFIHQVKQNGKLIFPTEKASNLDAVPYIILENGVFVANSNIGGEFELITSHQKNYTLKSAKEDVFILSDYSGKIIFEPGYPATIQPVEFTTLQWLTKSKDTNIKYFSGTAKYSISFPFPIDKVQNADSILLDLGEFESIAEVKLNNKSLGQIWRPGMYIPMKGILSSDNKLEVTIANTFRNRFIGDFIQFGEVRNLWTTSPVSNFLNRNLPLTPSGLNGPIRIIAFRKQVIK